MLWARGSRAADGRAIDHHCHGGTMTSTTVAPTRATLTSKQKAGLGLCILFSVANLPSVFESAPDGEAGPPFAILLVGTVLAVLGIVAGVMAWRGNPVAMRIAAGAIIVMTLEG